MKLKELYERLKFFMDKDVNDRHGDKEVVIKVSRPSLGPLASVSVREAGPGIDWDNNKFILWPEKELLEKEKEKKSNAG
jgi:hypothetical protein